MRRRPARWSPDPGRSSMPIYEFRCLDCKKRFDLVLSVTEYDPKKVKCPKCGAKKVERQWSRVFAVTSKKS